MPFRTQKFLQSGKNALRVIGIEGVRAIADIHKPPALGRGQRKRRQHDSLTDEQERRLIVWSLPLHVYVRQKKVLLVLRALKADTKLMPYRAARSVAADQPVGTNLLGIALRADDNCADPC